jgi:N-methylhydantoinase B/oxoprolinase/acetone carboxylase alpha subunit
LLDFSAFLTTIDLVVDDYGLETVQEYMYHIRSNAELSVRNLLKDVAKRAGTNILSAVDYLDDGSPVNTISVRPIFPSDLCLSDPITS